MVDAIVAFAVEKLTSFIAEEVTLLRGVKDEVEWLRDELRAMQSFLRDADKKQVGDDRVRDWVSKITDVSHDATDILETFQIEFGDDKAQESSSCFMGYLKACAFICKKPVNLHDIGKEIESLKKRVSDISARRERYGISNIGHSGEETSGGPSSLRRAASFVEEEVIGFEDVTNKLLYDLTNGGSCRTIVSIWGMGGLGKTTLARKLYQSMNVVDYFDYKAWICVSQEYKIMDLLRRLIKSFKGDMEKDELDKIERKEEDELKRYIRNFLEGSCYLVVIDDVWSEGAFETLSEALPDNGNGSRAIITTRSETVATRADRESIVHKLRFLNPKESWDLFSKKVSRRDKGIESCSAAMKSIAQEMVEKCGGLPLAIIVLAGLLSNKSGLEKWQEVKDDIWQELKEGNIQISELLTLSYNDLSPKIKLCFLYVGIFSEDKVIEVEGFIWMLIAEGFIPRGNRAMEKTAREFVNELTNRSLIQVVDTLWEETLTFKVHDLLRELAIDKAKEVNLFTICDSSKSYGPNQSRRCVIQNQGECNLSLGHSEQRIRSLVFFDYGSLEGIEFIFMKLKLLRVLILDKVIMNLFGEVIGTMVLLKFIRLYGVDTNIYIPPSIGNLTMLQTLDVRGFGVCVVLPQEMCKFEELRHLHGSFFGSLHIKSLTKLQTLGVVDSSQLSELNSANLSNLQGLDLSIKEGSSSSLQSICNNRCNLPNLSLSWRGDCPPLESLHSCKKLLKLHLSGPMLKIPTLVGFPPSLTRLILCESELVNDPMPVLESLPNLTSLELVNAYEGTKMVCGSNGFRQLEVLRITRLEELEEWEIKKGAMPLLKGLKVHECPKLRMLPQILKQVAVVGPSLWGY